MPLGIRPSLPLSAPRRILMVDDHRDTTDVFARVLRLHGYDVVPAYSCERAAALCLQQRFDLLITDIQLPDGDGGDLFRRLHAACGIRGIAFSGHAFPRDISAALRSGFSAYVTKPCTTGSMLAAIEDAFVTRGPPSLSRWLGLARPWVDGTTCDVGHPVKPPQRGDGSPVEGPKVPADTADPANAPPDLRPVPAVTFGHVIVVPRVRPSGRARAVPGR